MPTFAKWSNNTIFPPSLPLTGGDYVMGLQSGVNVKYLMSNYVLTSGSYSDPAWITSLDGAKLTALSVSTAKIADNAVTTAKIADNAVTFGKISNINGAIILGRSAGAAGNIQQLSSSGARTVLGLDTASSPQFTGLNLSGLTASSPVVTDASKNISTVSSPTSYSPTIGDGTNSFTTTTAQGVYYKLGALIFLQIRLVWTGKGSATAGSAVRISLPFSIGASTSKVAASIGYAEGVIFPDDFFTADGASGNAYLGLYSLSNSGSVTQLLVSDMLSAGELSLSLTYWTN